MPEGTARKRNHQPQEVRVKAVILAGGYGTRMSEETTVRPKPMVELGDRPILWHIMKIYAAHGITDFVICLGYKGHIIKDALGFVAVDGIDGVYCNFLDHLFAEIGRRYGERLWWTTMGEMAERVVAVRDSRRERVA